MGTHCADHVTPLYPQKLALTSLTGGGHSVGIIRVRTKATECSFSLVKVITIVSLVSVLLCDRTVGLAQHVFLALCSWNDAVVHL